MAINGTTPAPEDSSRKTTPPIASDIARELRLVSDLAGLLIWEADTGSHAISWTSGPSVLPELPRLDSLDGYLTINHPDDRQNVHLAFTRWLAGTHALDIQHRIVLPTGKTIWLHSRGDILDPGKSRLLGVAQDITAYHQWQEDADLLLAVQRVLEISSRNDAMLHDVGKILRDHLGLSAITFLAVSEPDDQLTLLHKSLNAGAPKIEPGDILPLSSFIPPDIAEILAGGTPVAVSDVTRDPRLNGQRANLEDRLFFSTLAIPFIQEGQWTMLMCASRQQPHEWEEHEAHLLKAVSERVNLRLERIRSTLDLRRSEERYRSLFDTMDEGFCIVKVIYDEAGEPVDYIFVTTNPAFEHHTGLHNAAGKYMRDLIPNHEDHWYNVYSEVDRTRHPVRLTRQAPHLGGRWFDLNAFPVGDPSQHHVAVLFTNITERMQAFENLKKFENHVQRALEIESVGIIFFSPDGPVTYANPAFLRMSGYTSEDIAAGRVRWDTMTPPEWMPNAQSAITEFLSFGRITPYEKEYIRKDGTRWWGLFAASRINETEGAKFIIDISAMKQAEAERDRLADIVEDSNDAIIRCDPDGQIIDVNHAATELYGYSRDEFLGRNIIDTAPPDHREEFAEKYALLLCGEHVPTWETVRHGKDNTPLQVEIRMSPIRNEHGEIVGCSGIVRDITERKRLEQAQEDFLAMASHDLKSPVTVLLGRAQLMRRRKTYDEAGLRTIIDQARRIERLATDLQHVVHIESGQLEFRPGHVDLIQLVRQALDRIPTDNTSLEVCTNLPEEPVIGFWDRDRISQVIDNLLSNAVKYSPDGGTITVCVIPHDQDIELRITDEGIGISPKLQQRLFTRFYRADDGGVASGLGLGLYISRMLIEAHGGDIDVTSTPDQGSTFTVRLPRNPMEDDLSHAPSTDIHAAS